VSAERVLISGRAHTAFATTLALLAATHLLEAARAARAARAAFGKALLDRATLLAAH
jgi:hypothetical protein